VKLLGSSMSALTLSVLASLIFTIKTTDNPAQVPFRLVFQRAAFGMFLFMAFWLPVCLLFAWVLVHAVPLLDTEPVRWCLFILIGLVLPQAGKLKDAFLTPRSARYLMILQVIDEETRLYLSRIITREERKASTLFFGEDTERRQSALDRLYEEHNLEIARDEARRLRSSKTALGIFKVRHPAVKFKYLIRYLGYCDCREALRSVAARPQTILPSWPADVGDRRTGSGADNALSHTGHPLRRRKYEQPSVQAYVLEQIRQKHQVFVSSTYLDLKEERQQVLRCLLGCDCIPSGMEFFPSSDEELWSLIRGVVDECDYYILLVGGRYGSVTREGISYTEAEYDYAVSTGRPVLAFLHAAPGSLETGESPEKQERLQAFRDKICRAHAPGYWSEASELPFLVQKAIENLKRERSAKA
jgi:hypothetical protein